MSISRRHMGGRARHQVVVASTFAAAAALPFLPPLATDARLTQLQLVAALALILLGLNVVLGYSGQAAIGHGGFVLVGATAAAALSTRGLHGVEIPAPLSIIAAALLSSAVGYGLGRALSPLGGPQFAVATLGFALSVGGLMRSDLGSSLIGGQTLTVQLPSAPAALHPIVGDAQWRYLLLAGPAILSGLAVWSLLESRFGRALRAIREDEVAAGAARCRR